MDDARIKFGVLADDESIIHCRFNGKVLCSKVLADSGRLADLLYSCGPCVVQLNNALDCVAMVRALLWIHQWIGQKMLYIKEIKRPSTLSRA